MFTEFLKKFLNKIYNKGRPSFLSEITVLNATLGGRGPEIYNVARLDHAAEEFLYEFDLSFRGPL